MPEPAQLAFEIAADIPVLRAGTDEVGRGPLAGDVVAAAVILDPQSPIAGLNDSKKLTERARERCYEQIRDQARAWAIGRASAVEIDAINILQASMLAMQRAVMALSLQPEFVFVDGNRCPDWPYRSKAVVGGDGLVPEIAAASILAKVTRDREMVALEQTYPGYGFARHKGYPTALHMTALEKLGPCAIHRCSFAPVARCLDANKR